MTAAPVALARRPGAPPEGTAAADLAAVDLAGLRAVAADADADAVERALARPRRGLDDFAALISEAALDRLEDLAAAARQLTVRRFGPTMRMFAPLYLSNVCVSVCTYCGFSAGNDIVRRTLTPAEAAAEAATLAATGFRHLLLVSGEHARIISPAYLADCVRAVAPHMPSVSLEVQVWNESEYGELVAAGADGLVVYQETYDRAVYASVHRLGKKRNYDWRLAAPDRGAAAGMRRLGIGALLGLNPDWRSDALALAAHARALLRRWWRVEVTVSLPRLRPCAGLPDPPGAIDDRRFAGLVCALRLLLPDVGIVLSTREPPHLRDGLVPLGVTHMSAGSHAEPGGYSAPSTASPQFLTSDGRSPAEVAAALRAAGYDPVWKDWERL